MLDYNFKKYYCCEKGKEPIPIEYPSSSMYIVLNRNCNAACPFCTFRGKVERVDLKQLDKTLTEILKVCNLGTVHITGGEPSLYLEDIKQICNIVKKHNSCITTSCNTNGYAIKELLEMPNLDNVALSRHAISDEDNQILFATDTVPTVDVLQSLPNKHKLHVSCNLIKGYIDSEDKILKYLDFVGDVILCNDVGFVGLMKVNDFCNQHFLHMPKLHSVCKSRELEDKENGKVYCNCKNYLYLTPQNHMVSAYYRRVVEKRPFNDIFIYENNILRQGW